LESDQAKTLILKDKKFKKLFSWALGYLLGIEKAILRKFTGLLALLKFLVFQANSLNK